MQLPAKEWVGIWAGLCRLAPALDCPGTISSSVLHRNFVQHLMAQEWVFVTHTKASGPLDRALREHWSFQLWPVTPLPVSMSCQDTQGHRERILGYVSLNSQPSAEGT